MANSEISRLLNIILDALCEIDNECRTLRNGIEHGLVNVKLEFAGRRLTEEPLIACLAREKLKASGVEVHPDEVPYPGSGKRCDVVIDLPDSSRLWLELKLASKAWFNCVGPPEYSNPAYATYLDGRDRTHSLRHDFEKLRSANLPAGDHRAVCLIGFDCAAKPMDSDVAKIVRQARGSAPWEAAAERHWPDRRSRDFRINVWIWLLPASATKQSASAKPEHRVDRKSIGARTPIATDEQLYDVEAAIAALQMLGPALIRGSTATAGHQYYEQVRAVGLRLKKCICGQRKKGWKYPEFIATAGGKVLSVGADAKSNKISCGDKGFHSSRYSSDPPCC